MPTWAYPLLRRLLGHLRLLHASLDERECSSVTYLEVVIACAFARGIPYTPSLLGLVTFQVLSRHLWLGITALVSSEQDSSPYLSYLSALNPFLLPSAEKFLKTGIFSQIHFQFEKIFLQIAVSNNYSSSLKLISPLFSLFNQSCLGQGHQQLCPYC